jgi:hypothetical protein
LVFFAKRTGNEDIWLLPLNERKRPAGPLVQLTTHPDRDMNPFFAPDGRHIAWQSDRSGANELWVMRADGSGQRSLSNLPGGGHFSPWLDTNSVVWSRRRVFIDGREPEPFLGHGGGHLSFSPDLRFVLENDHTALYVGRVATNETWNMMSNVFQFAEANVGMDYSVWSPSGRWALLDRTTPLGGDIFLLRDVE